MCQEGGAKLHEDLGPVEGWIAYTSHTIGFVKGCFQPLPLLFYTPRIVDGRKTWILPRTVPPDEGLAAGREPCLGGRETLLLRPGRARLESPVAAAKRLRSCSTRLCRAALQLLDELRAYTELAGVTGGLAYNPAGAGDIDIVVYGTGIEEVYKLLQDLRIEGVTRPYHGRGHGWSRADMELNRAIAGDRVLIGYMGGFEYNVKLVPCRRPARCTPIRILAEGALVRGVLRPVSPYTVPALYKLELEKPLRLGLGSYNWIYLLTHRLRYTEMPRGLRVEVLGDIEHFEGSVRLVPDHGGYVKPLNHRPGPVRP
ncbi:hypothetical protein CF15_04095 [Pyrodictium occultum]|uniref:Uncharacterized protein n=1 Tax=Pyrodictium occultum TaxID=2309 RepID=A0A0V8RVI9_PYROC|nr:hypothetical protein [Pyrodictium occultum]KSW11978.1 hypothetical protein CF15_04095 [Pyrodictium occultum]